MSKALKASIKALICGALSFLLYYVFLPPINLRTRQFWLFLIAVLLIFGIPFGIIDLSALDNLDPKARKRKEKRLGKEAVKPVFKKSVVAVIYFSAIAVMIAVVLLGTLFSSVVFNAKAYSEIIDVKDCDFAEDMPTTDEVKNIALMDTDSAKMLGNRKLGALANVVSQFCVNESYTQINFNSSPKKVAPLEYDGFFKWLNNRKDGIPGYIMVDAIENYAEYCETDGGMVYSESAYFSEDLRRALRFAYPTKIFGNISFEVDENGNPFYIVSCENPKVALFGAQDIVEVILFDPISGSHELMALEDVPTWIDIVFDGDLACQKYDWKGIYSGGFFNSLIGNKGCKQTTDDFGYIMLDDDVWYFTGVTSVTASDASNIGFIISNARTGEYKFYSVIGAEEHSAMGAAEGEVQEKEYVASFPSLINVAGQPSYIMVLKDAHGLVKLYALVNVQQYNMVATGETQADAIRAYIKTLAQNGIDVSNSQDAPDTYEKIVIADIKYLAVSGSTTVYITAENGNVYKMDFNSKNEAIILKRVGDEIYVNVTESDIEGIYNVTHFSLTDPNGDR